VIRTKKWFHKISVRSRKEPEINIFVQNDLQQKTLNKFLKKIFFLIFPIFSFWFIFQGKGQIRRTCRISFSKNSTKSDKIGTLRSPEFNIFSAASRTKKIRFHPTLRNLGSIFFLIRPTQSENDKTIGFVLRSDFNFLYKKFSDEKFD